MKKVAFTESFGGRRRRAEEACGDCSVRGALTPHHPPAAATPASPPRRATEELRQGAVSGEPSGHSGSRVWRQRRLAAAATPRFRLRR